MLNCNYGDSSYRPHGFDTSEVAKFGSYFLQNVMKTLPSELSSICDRYDVVNNCLKMKSEYQHFEEDTPITTFSVGREDLKGLSAVNFNFKQNKTPLFSYIHLRGLERH